jgi:D-sedoheptulose 7-phosphate isomerase
LSLKPLVLIRECQIYTHNFLEKFGTLNLESVIGASKEIFSCIENGNSIYVCGNGGSASLSQHFAIDLGLGLSRKIGSNGCRIFDLTSNAAVLTATANDVSYQKVFSDQIELYGNQNDILIVISSSGNSVNVVRAVETASTKGMKTIGLTGFDGGEIKSKVNYSIHVRTEIGEYGVVEDSHSFVLHLLTHLVKKQIEAIET